MLHKINPSVEHPSITSPADGLKPLARDTSRTCNQFKQPSTLRPKDQFVHQSHQLA